MRSFITSDRIVSCLVLSLILIGCCSSQATAGEIILLNGDRLSGDIIERTRDAVVIEHTALGRIHVPIDSIRVVRTPRVLFPTTPGDGDLPPLPIEVIDEDDEAEPAPDAEGEAERAHDAVVRAAAEQESDVQWNTELEVGANATAGTSDTTRLRSSIRTTRTSPRSTFRFDATYRFGTNRGEKTENHFTTGLFAEWPRPDSPWSVFVQGRYDYSEFQSWEHRLSASGGFGFRLFDVKKITDAGEEVDLFHMKLRGGAGVRKEFGSLDEDLDPEGLAGFDLAWRINDSMRLEAGSTAFPSLRYRREFRVISTVDWIINLNMMNGLSLKLGAAHEYESMVDPGIDNHDLSVYSTLMLRF